MGGKQLVDRQKQDNQRLKYELLRQINDQRAQSLVQVKEQKIQRAQAQQAAKVVVSKAKQDMMRQFLEKK